MHLFLLQVLQEDGDLIHCLLHLLVIALVGLSNLFVAFAAGNSGENAIALLDRQQDGVKQFIYSQEHLTR